MSRDVAIVDHGLGNLFSVERACAAVGMEATITQDPAVVAEATAIILPGVGSFPTAMQRLTDRDLVAPLREAPQRGQYLIGICLGAQLLLSRSTEQGETAGLGCIPGSVIHLQELVDDPAVRVPHVGWNTATPTHGGAVAAPDELAALFDAPLEMYFVHSYVLETDTAHCLATTAYAGEQFCAVVAAPYVIGVQFHPERSGPAGIALYEQIHALIG